MIALVARRNVAPAVLIRCPVHSSLVALDGDGRLLGRCDGCINEAARALTAITLMPHKNKQAQPRTPQSTQRPGPTGRHSRCSTG